MKCVEAGPNSKEVLMYSTASGSNSYVNAFEVSLLFANLVCGNEPHQAT